MARSPLQGDCGPELRRHHERQVARRAAWAAADAWLANIRRWHCVKEQYAAYVGDWHDHYGNYRWYPLPGGDHTALGDCRATLALMQRMASGEKGEQRG